MTDLENKGLEQEKKRKKRYLNRYKKNLALINRLEEKLADLDERICKVKSPNYSGMPRGGTPISLEELIADKIEIEERINRLIEKSKRLKAETLEKIDELDDTRYAEILESFFIECKTFRTIAENTGYTERHVIRLYSEAVMAMSF